MYVFWEGRSIPFRIFVYWSLFAVIFISEMPSKLAFTFNTGQCVRNIMLVTEVSLFSVVNYFINKNITNIKQWYSYGIISLKIVQELRHTKTTWNVSETIHGRQSLKCVSNLLNLEQTFLHFYCFYFIFICTKFKHHLDDTIFSFL